MVEQVIAETGAVCPKDMGKVMKELVSRIGMQADAKKMSELVKNKLGMRHFPCKNIDGEKGRGKQFYPNVIA